MAKGFKTGGRVAGTPNKATRDTRAAIAVFAEANIDKIDQWLNEIEDPAKRLDLFLRALEYHQPKLARTETTVSGHMTFSMSDDQRKARIKELQSKLNGPK